MEKELLEAIKYNAHMVALSRSFSKEDLRNEARRHAPMTMIGVGHVQTIVAEMIEKFNLNNNGNPRVIINGIVKDLQRNLEILNSKLTNDIQDEYNRGYSNAIKYIEDKLL